jgi:hypothetical protein
MFKKLKEKIEDTNGLDKSLSSVKKAPGLPMRAASNDTVPNSITPLRSESIGDIMADKMDSSREDINTDNDVRVAFNTGVFNLRYRWVWHQWGCQIVRERESCWKRLSIFAE